MSSLIYKFLLFSVLFLSLFLFAPKSVLFAQTTYFFDDFNGTSIDSTKWDISNLISGKRWCPDYINNQFVSGLWFDVATDSCHGTIDSLPLGSVTVSNSEATFSSGTSRTFPYMSTGLPSLLPFPQNGNFSFETHLKYNSISPHGTGTVALTWGDTTTEGNNPPGGPENAVFSVWADGNGLFITLFGNSVSLGNPYEYHTYRLEYKDGKYSVLVDGELMVGPTVNSLRPTAILIGNPVFAFWNPWDWSDFSIDYIKVSGLDSAPAPFLDLPWDYQAKGESFSEAALSINSYFDHTYPLLSARVSLSEPSAALNQITSFDGITYLQEERSYSSHDGYDYAKLAKVNLGDPVLAAASGQAEYVNICNACGNMILIDHGNGYQTRYLHLQKDGLITNVPGQKVWVNNRQQIGKVGSTGNSTGAHIHFGVFQDKNNDGNFNDNVPDGVTDPFGWQSKEPDPWENYSFIQNEIQKTGNRSYYLWKKQLDNLNATLTANGGVFTAGKTTVDFPQGITNTNLKLILQAEPEPILANGLAAIGSAIGVTTEDIWGNLVTGFEKAFTISFDLSNLDTSKVDPETISIYSTEDGLTWTKEVSTLDSSGKIISTTITHLSHFVIAGVAKDTTAPTSESKVIGQEGQKGWFRSDVTVSLSTEDNENGSGVDYTLYKTGNSDWDTYTEPLEFSSEGHYKIEFYSADIDGNIEDVKTEQFDIDKTPPIASIWANPSVLWSPNGKLIPVEVSGSAYDLNLASKTFSVDDEYDFIEPLLSDFGTIQLESKRKGGDLDGREYIINVEAEDLAGNKTSSQAVVLVPHDDRNEK